MYKTVRHGENSLQYTILPQQDDGAGVATRPTGKRHRKKGKRAAVFAITIVLICGVIATAVLVPLLLTSDLVTLPAAFQKFSVASMHTMHVGSHKEIVAKKPIGWQPHHIQILTTTTKVVPTTTQIPTTDTSTTTTTTTTSVPTTTQEKLIEVEKTTLKSTAVTTPSTTTALLQTTTVEMVSPSKTHMAEVEWRYTISSQEHGDHTDRVHSDSVSAKVPWYLPTFRWPMYQERQKLLIPIIAGGGAISLCIIITIVFWMKRGRSKKSRIVLERGTAEKLTPDKENLLTDPAGLSDEEQ